MLIPPPANKISPLDEPQWGAFARQYLIARDMGSLLQVC